MTASSGPAARLLPWRGAVVAFAVVAALLAAGAPLAAYAESLAFFGLAHVLAERRYVDGRFGRRIGRGQLASIAVLLALAVSMRALALAGSVDAVTAIVVELGGVAVMAFVVVPLLIATGLPAVGMAALGGFASDRTFGSVGVLSSHLRVFVPRGWFAPETATHVFAAATYLQLMHYGAVLLVLPRLLSVRGDERAGDAPLFPWPRWPVLVLAIAAAALATSALFVQDLRGTRAAYGLLAAVHAWIEIPMLLLAMSPLLTVGRRDAARAVTGSPAP